MSVDDRDNLSPTSPTFQTASQLPRSYPNVRGHAPAFPSTPTTNSFAPPPVNRVSLVLDAPTGVTYSDYISSWTDDHVARWLTDIRCSAHITTFKANDIRGDVLLELDQDTLKEMGVASIGDRLRMVNAVKTLRTKSAGSRLSINTKNHSRTSSEQHSPTGASRLNRRLEQGRPAPLQLNSSNGGALPSIAKAVSGDAPDSARPGNSGSSQTGSNPRPLPHPSVPSASNPTPTSNGSSQAGSARSHLPPLPPPPKSQPPMPPPGRLPARGPAPRRTTPGEVYVTPGERGASLLTPSTATSGPWSGYGLPSNPRPASQVGDRAVSPLNINRNPGRLTNQSHNRNSSVASPGSGSPARSGPYSGSGLGIPASQRDPLSPIIEKSFGSDNSGSGSPPNSGGSNPYRGPFYNNNGRPSTPLQQVTSPDGSRRKLVKFLLPEEGRSCTIDVVDCPGGVEVLEKVLKKFNKPRGQGDDMDYVQTTPEGGLSVDGWAVYWGPGDGRKTLRLCCL